MYTRIKAMSNGQRFFVLTLLLSCAMVTMIMAWPEVHHLHAQVHQLEAEKDSLRQEAAQAKARALQAKARYQEGSGYQEADLWLARALWSETKRSSEMELVAWVIRSRKESSHYPDTYREVVLQPYQFSAFNTEKGRDRYASLNEKTSIDTFQQALRWAYHVRRSPQELNPLEGNVLHYYSPVSMRPKHRVPDWAKGKKPVKEIGDRFRFYAGLRAGA